MGRRIELPRLPAGTPEQQLKQLYSYLYQMAETLNRNMEEAGEAESGGEVTARVTKTGNIATITITDRNGTTAAQIFDGTNGSDIIDDTAGQGTTNKTWSADKISEYSTALGNIGLAIEDGVLVIDPVTAEDEEDER